MPMQILESWFAGVATTLFQPIVEIASAETFALEALSRGPVGTPLESANALFELVRTTRQEVRADRRCIEAALRIASCETSTSAIALNVHPTTLERDGHFPEFLAATLMRERIDPQRVILEILEEPREWEIAPVVAAIRELRGEGVRVALDDVGVGFWSRRTIAQLSPDFLKVDRQVVNGCASDEARRSVLCAIRQLACELGACVVAEGIEHRDDLDAVTGLGIPYGQGFLFSHPRPLADVLERPLELPGKMNKETQRCSERRSSSWTTPTPF